MWSRKPPIELDDEERVPQRLCQLPQPCVAIDLCGYEHRLQGERSLLTNRPPPNPTLPSLVYTAWVQARMWLQRRHPRALLPTHPPFRFQDQNWWRIRRDMFITKLMIVRTHRSNPTRAQCLRAVTFRFSAVESLSKIKTWAIVKSTRGNTASHSPRRSSVVVCLSQCMICVPLLQHSRRYIALWFRRPR